MPGKERQAPRLAAERSSSLEEGTVCESLDAHRLGRLLAVLLVCSIPALVDPGAVRRTADLFPLAAGPYFALDHAGLLYLWMPAVVLSASLLFLTPGLLVALALGAGRTVASWVVTGLALSIVGVSAVAAAAQALLRDPLRGEAFALVVLACVAAAAAALAVRLRRGDRVAWPLAEPFAAFTTASLVAVPTTLLALMVPKFFWEDFNGDGLHTFEAVRRLLFSALPFFPPDMELSTYPGIRTLLVQYPLSWYLRLFGECEASVRLPFPLFLAGLYAAVLAAVEHGRAALVGLVERSLLWVGVTTFGIAMGYSATYNVYHADIGLPATQDTLLLSLFLGFAVAQARGELGWACLFAVLSYTCSPAGLLLLGLWLAGSVLLIRPVPWRAVTALGVVLGACLLAEIALPSVLVAAGALAPGAEHSLGSLLSKLQSLQYRQWRRIAYLLLPSGILPALALALWRRQDAMGRMCAGIALTTFVFFYFQRKTALHYYAPAMVLPLVTFWRLDVWSSERLRRPLLTAAAAAALVALVVTLPRHSSVYTYARVVGASIEDRIAPSGEADISGYSRARLLRQVIPSQADASVPAESFGEGSIVLYFYRSRTPDTDSANYVFQRSEDLAPSGARRVASRDGVDLYVKDPEVLAQHLALRPPQPSGSRFYDVPKGSLFAD